VTIVLRKKSRVLVLTAALLAVFLGALDALIIGAAMPTIIADLGSLELYSWVFSAYMLTRTIALPLFGKLMESLSSKALTAIRASIGEGVEAVFWTALLVSFLSIIMCKMIPERKIVR